MEAVVMQCATQEMVPTPERLRKGRFEQRDGTLRLVSAVRVLQDSGDIGDDEVAAAARWYRDFVLADHGAVDVDPLRVSSGERGDIHTWMIGRGKSAARIGAVRDALGLCAHVRLQMMLAHEMSFSAMARILYPAESAARGRMKVSAQCAFLLEQLAAFYQFSRQSKYFSEKTT